MIRAAKSGDWTADDAGTVVSGGVKLKPDEYTLETSAAGTERAVGLLPGGGLVVLDTRLTPELLQEGLANDVVRAVQQARRAAELDITARSSLVLAGPESLVAAATAHHASIATETLATDLSVRLEPPTGPDVVTATVGDDLPLTMTLTTHSCATTSDPPGRMRSATVALPQFDVPHGECCQS